MNLEGQRRGGGAGQHLMKLKHHTWGPAAPEEPHLSPHPSASGGLESGAIDYKFIQSGNCVFSEQNRRGT